MMMGVGLLMMLLFLLVLVGVPVLIIVWAAKGGLKALSRPRSQATGSEAQQPSSRAIEARRCPTCGRPVQVGWNVCPSCGAALT
ncbi:MAG: hypothetical protein A2Z37_08015 [Chloroflexi bacterium RBG_19FT_COMBO_62_14]|nr:MAG: hypothetical protein A2Z37_08015 [Chloroflexi bacterium RBG_19FT_COMBO_62_14]